MLPSILLPLLLLATHTPPCASEVPQPQNEVSTSSYTDAFLSRTRRAALPSQSFLVSLGFNNNKWYHYCGGVLIKPQWVLTAAHCVEPTTILRDSVRIGGRLLANAGEFEQYTVAKYILHPQYSARTDANDIALLKLSRPAKKRPTDINRVAGLDDNMSVLMMGWGARDDRNVGQVRDGVLAGQYVKTSRKACARGTSTSMLCIAVTPALKARCFGDSGGPLMSNGKVVGISARGAGCDSKRSVGTYTRVASYAKWIDANAK